MQPLPTRKHVLNTLFENWTPERKTEIISIDDALGRVLAQYYGAAYSFPVVRSSGMDGVAVSSERFKDGIPDTSNWKIGIDFCRADTGDDFDDRFDAAIPIEDVVLTADNRLTINPYVKVVPNLNVRPCGDMIKQGEPVGIKNRRLRSFDIACLAMGGITEVEVYQKPKVAFIPSGSELIPLGESPVRNTNIDSNSILVKNMLRGNGCRACYLPHSKG